MSRPKGAPVKIRREEFTPEDAVDRARRLGIGDELGRLAEARLVPVDQVHPNPEQPRKTIDAAALEELAGSIRARGILQPLRLRRVPGGFQIVAGERRWRAARLAGLADVPAIVVEQDDANAFVDALIENVVREDLNPLERADAVRRLRQVLGLSSWDDVAARIGVSRRTVHVLLGIVDLPPEIQEHVRAGDLKLQHVEALRQLGRRPELQEQAYHRIVDEGLSGDAALALARSMRQTARTGAMPVPSVSQEDQPPAPVPIPGVAPTAAPEPPSDRLAVLGRELRAVVGAIRSEADRPHPAADRAALLAELDWARQAIDAIRTRLAP